MFFNLEGIWKVVFLEVSVLISKLLKICKFICVYLNICGEFIVNGDREFIFWKL